MSTRTLLAEQQERREAVIHGRALARSRLLAASPGHRLRAYRRLAALRWWRT